MALGTGDRYLKKKTNLTLKLIPFFLLASARTVHVTYKLLHAVKPPQLSMLCSDIS